VTFDDRIEHDIVRHFIGAGFDHADFFFRTSERDMHLALGALLFRGIDDDLAIDQADMDAGDRAIPRDVRDRDGDGGAEHGGYFRCIVLVYRHDHVADGAVISQVFREQRADRAVDDAGCQALALEEAARNASGGVGVLAIVDGQGEEVARHRARGHAGGRQHHGVAEAHGAGAVGLLGQVAGLHDQAIGADGDFDSVLHQGSFVRSRRPGRQAGGRRPSAPRGAGDRTARRIGWGFPPTCAGRVARWCCGSARCSAA